MRFLHRFIVTKESPFHGGMFTASIQIRFKKPADTAQTRLEGRTRDPKLDLIAFQHCRLAHILNLYKFISSKKRGPYVSLQLLSRWAQHVGLNTLTGGDLVRKYPHIFEVFTHPIRRNVCCKFRPKFVELLDLEDEVVHNTEESNVIKIRKILSMSVTGRIHLHAIRLMRRELGLPENFRDSIILKYSDIFRMIDLEIVELVDWNGDKGLSCFSPEIEIWRERQYREKWLSEFETKYAFPINFPTGFKKVPGFRDRLKNWQRVSYVKPYEKMEKVRVRSCGGIERYEKRAVGIIHELLCLTVEKMVEVERLAHFRKDLGIEINLREVLLKHPGIFYVSTRGNVLMVFLREAYVRGCLIGANAVYDVRRRMLELMLLGCRNTRVLRENDQGGEEEEDGDGVAGKDGYFVIPILKRHSSKPR
ncbi:protein ROOT PRIMORDIUM DEFECTIVE 1 [Andrographis paniculata]|uniref:protein ROOT PRIMORDIUM DEFECTIVE 1 n=1 Tax=Andrographis paniculata TaxID=175694 RepID=UPI0021E8F974|nr:protein ROOT PRIMORDIUM DEFECTIVE 1 [Andrographis paniculata]XP_051149191.1 protein ROOT PRIMORDIUM DEFECTIVE 1 [Andrographis paniculata]XP_051149201.1 protein ROOT PRIMORDIUM DEFECTIVE 1 [Andrographis paniculata]XP_051149204.1 protein ROOT PRIMORDIUM DEFECTIVE 1 [Andrographis paniculata]XP_051149213.1 protein ROOT PRIMORDIUM DEFECTIVE 1 [Andrographis paniculata]